MKNAFAAELGPCAANVLETMFFTTALSCIPAGTEAAFACSADSVHAAIEFHGPPDGKLRLCCSSEAITALAASFLGTDESEITSENSGHVAGELANMICGSVLSRCAPHSLFGLEQSREPLCTNDCDTSFSIELPEGVITICARVDRL